MLDLEFDRQHIWHPYTSLIEPLPVYPVERTDGVRIYLEDGTDLVDGMASWWSAIHGYNHPELNQALLDQSRKMSHVMFGGLTHDPAISLCKALVALAPEKLNKVFLSDSGSVAVEVAIKMALQYWMSCGEQGKNRLLTLRGGYHGDTMGAMSVCDPVTGMHELFTDTLMPNLFAPRPDCRFGEPCTSEDLKPFRELIEMHHQSLAAVILEPIVQGAGGMYFYSADYLRAVRELCDEFNVLLIADEIATGLGRTGRMFACEWADITPDILCLGKALTGGYLSLAATLCTDDIAEAISRRGVFMHGPTFMGNPLSCALAVKSLELLEKSDWKQLIHRIESQLLKELWPAKELATVTDARVLGAIGVLEMTQPIDMAQAQKFFVKRGVWIRPFGRLLYIMPPYIIAPEDLRKLTGAMLEFAAGLNGR